MLRTCQRLVLLGGVLPLVLAPAAAHAQGDVASEIKRRIEQLRVTGNLAVAGETVQASGTLAELYEGGGFAPLWGEAGDAIGGRAAADLDRLLRDVFADGLDPADYHARGIARLAGSLPTPSRDAELDLLRTDALLRVAEHLRYGKVDATTLKVNRDLSRPLTGGAVVATIADMLRTGSLYERVMALRPSHFVYRGLVVALQALREVRDAGGWPKVPAGPTLHPGDEDPRVPALRRRLAADVAVPSTAPLPASMASDSASMRLDSPLEAVVKSFQHRHGLNVDGVVGVATLAELNVPVEVRIEQVRVNLERARWVAHGLADTFVAVNVAGAMVYYVRGGNVLFETRAVVGLPYRATPVFSATMRYIDLNPTWTVPPGIVSEVLAQIRRNPGYLARERIQVLDRAGNLVNRTAIDYSRYSGRTFPYVFRQEPGPLNPLGRIKLVFPNRYNVYLHDTPSRELFEREQRTFSHGCIRVQDPLRLAELVLNEPARWSRDSLEAAIEQGGTRTIELPRPVPVLVLYWTASTDLHRELHFYRDVYDRDPAVLRALDEPYS